MLYPLFDKDCELVAWIEPGKNIFSVDMDWIAYIVGNQAWSAETGNWLGPVRGLLCLDTSGNVVAWNPLECISGEHLPARPARAAGFPVLLDLQDQQGQQSQLDLLPRSEAGLL